MHNFYILGGKKVPKLFWGAAIGAVGNIVGGMLSKKKGDNTSNTGSATVNNVGSNNTMNSIAGIAGGALGAINAQGNTSQKQMQRADSIVDGVSSAVSLIPGVGTAIGAGIQLVNRLGGAFVKQPSWMKSYSTNQNVLQNAAAFGGVASNALGAEATAQSYNKSGLVGKLVGRNKGTRNRFATAASQQDTTQGILDENTYARENMFAGADLFSTRNTMNLQGNMWNKGNILFGRTGVKLVTKNQQGGSLFASNTLNKAISNHFANKNKTASAPVKTTTKPIANTAISIGNTERNHWNGFVDFVDSKGLKGSTDLDNRDKSLSKDLWNEYSSSNNLNLEYEQFIPAVQKEIQNYRATAIDRIKSGQSRFKDFTNEQVNDPSFDWDNNFMKGLSDVDGWAGSRTTSWKFPSSVIKNKSTGDTLKVDNKPIPNKTYTKFKQGGTIEEKVKNVIVEGPLHSRRHKLKLLDEFKDADITLKGIPVIRKSEGGKIRQIA